MTLRCVTATRFRCLVFIDNFPLLEKVNALPQQGGSSTWTAPRLFTQASHEDVLTAEVRELESGYL